MFAAGERHPLSGESGADSNARLRGHVTGLALGLSGQVGDPTAPPHSPSQYDTTGASGLTRGPAGAPGVELPWSFG